MGEVAIGASVACYLASLFLPAVVGASASAPGWQCLVVGWSALLLLNPIWLANPAWLAALIALGRRRFGVAGWIGLGASTLSLLTILYVWRGLLMIPVVGLGEWDSMFTSLGPGFYAWSAAMWIPTLAAAFLRRQSKLEAEGGPGRF